MTETQPRNVAYPGLFRATYYINPAFTGLQAGSQSNPFTTVAAAFAAAAVLGQTAGVIYLPPGVTVVENVTFPTTGNWELSTTVFTQANRAILNGTIVLSSVAAVNHSIRNIIVLGAVSGDQASASTNRLFICNAELNSTLTLTASGGGVGWRVFIDGGISNTSAATGIINGVFGTASIVGALYCFSCNLSSFTVSVSSLFTNVWLNTGPLNTAAAGAISLTFEECGFNFATTIAATTGSVQAIFDGVSFASATAVGLVAGTACTTKTLNSNQSSITTETGNRAQTALGGAAPNGLYELVFDATLLTAGTAGTLVVNVIYTDMTGTLVTVPVGTTLLITAALGTKAQGSLPFHHNGATGIAFSTTGVVTPGALSVALAVAVRRVD